MNKVILETMKTAISIPDDLFSQAEKLAHQSKLSRSELYARAIRDYIRRHSRQQRAREVDEVINETAEPLNGAVARHNRQMLRKVQW